MPHQLVLPRILYRDCRSYIFSAAEQHVLGIDSEAFGPITARFQRVGTHRYDGPAVKRITNPDGTSEYIYRDTSYLIRYYCLLS